MRGHSVDDGAGDDGADEGGGFADYVEEGEEEEFFAAGGDFRDLKCVSSVVRMGVGSWRCLKGRKSSRSLE